MRTSSGKAFSKERESWNLLIERPSANGGLRNNYIVIKLIIIIIVEKKKLRIPVQENLKTQQDESSECAVLLKEVASVADDAFKLLACDAGKGNNCRESCGSWGWLKLNHPRAP